MKKKDKSVWRERVVEGSGHNIEGLDVHPIAHRLLMARGIDSVDAAQAFLTPNYDTDLHDPFLFRDMRKVVDRIKKAQENQEIVGIFGDHDVDGISSAVLMSEALEKFGIECDVYIPDKHSEGHGINKKAIDQFKERGVTLMISVDCGSTNHDEITYAKEHAIETIVLDHHNAPEKLPDVHAMINPKVAADTYPFTGICGTAVVFKVVTALYHELCPDDIGELKWLLDIVGIGTVADVMPLIDENRTIVKYGLVVLSKTRRIGYQEMIDVGRIPINDTRIPDAQTIAFQIAPRINAAGRMAHARDAYDLLHETDRDAARTRAENIETLNIERRKLTDRIVKEVTKIVERDHKGASSIAIASAQYPVGIIGIIAGRIASAYNCPVGIFHIRGTGVKDGEMQGSFRTAVGVNVAAALDACDDILIKYGGHDQAAGATLEQKDFDAFAQKFNDAVVAQQSKDIKTDAGDQFFDTAVTPHDIDFALVDTIEQFAPFGEGNPEPVFAVHDMIVIEKRSVGSTKKHIKLLVRPNVDSPQTFGVIGFNAVKLCEDIDVDARVDLLCTLNINEWNGSREVQMTLVDIRVAQ